jgi:2-keto-myo-inositol isomerase
MRRALNQATTPGLSYPEFLDLAAALGCVGVEPRNDLARPLFDGINPTDAGRMARDKGLRLVGLSQVYPFNDWSDARACEVADLIATAKACGAETISLIPRVDGERTADGERQADLRYVLQQILPMLRDSDLLGLVEPIGFTTSSLKDKAELVEVIEALGARDHIKLVHDTFQHILGGGGGIFPDHTGMVHISGISGLDAPMEDKLDSQRVLVDQHDRLDNVEQIATLQKGGYRGPFSFECTSAEIHALANPEAAIRHSFEFISSRLRAVIARS